MKNTLRLKIQAFCIMILQVFLFALGMWMLQQDSIFVYLMGWFCAVVNGVGILIGLDTLTK